MASKEVHCVTSVLQYRKIFSLIHCKIGTRKRWFKSFVSIVDFADMLIENIKTVVTTTISDKNFPTFIKKMKLKMKASKF